MAVIDSIDEWLASLSASLDSADVEVRVQRSPSDRPIASRAINLRRGEREVDLVVWETGLADLIVARDVESPAFMEHHDDLLEPKRLRAVLTRMLEGIAFVEPSKD